MKYLLLCRGGGLLRSPPSRGAWIEIVCCMAGRIHRNVAPLTGGVD